MKKTMYLWVFLMVILISGLTFIGFKIKDNNKKYKEVEKKLISAAQGYFGEQPSLLKNNAIVQDYELKKYKESLDFSVENDQCKGYVKVKSSMGLFDYEPYIKCNNYTTKGYVEQQNTCESGC